MLHLNEYHVTSRESISILLIIRLGDYAYVYGNLAIGVTNDDSDVTFLL